MIPLIENRHALSCPLTSVLAFVALVLRVSCLLSDLFADAESTPAFYSVRASLPRQPVRRFFHVLAIVNNASINIGHMYLFELEFSLDICLGVGLLAHTVT